MVSPEDYRLLLEAGTPCHSGATIIITVYDYEKFVTATLQSTVDQTFAPLSLIIVEDCSKDESLDRCLSWLTENASRFEYAVLAQHTRNRGLAQARNTAFSIAHTPYIFVLDADNILYSRCVEWCHAFLHPSNAAFSYPLLEKFGDEVGLMGMQVWSKSLLSLGNYIDAMALVRKSAWEAVSGYSSMTVTGWEDYDLWCKFAGRGWEGIRVPIPLARYRIHKSSMLNTVTNRKIQALTHEMVGRHPWLRLR